MAEDVHARIMAEHNAWILAKATKEAEVPPTTDAPWWDEASDTATWCPGIQRQSIDQVGTNGGARHRDGPWNHVHGDLY